MTFKPVPIGPFMRGLVATTDPYSQPRGTFPRGSNLLLTKRGAVRTCDGSLILHEFSGAVQTNRGKVMENFLFSPTGVSRYYLSLMKCFDQHLGAPTALSVVTAAGGTLAAATYFYKVVALDNAGGQTTASNEVSIATGANGKNTLTWNLVPNATFYNVYRSTSAGTEVLLTAINLPVLQPALSAGTVSYVDDGTVNPPITPIVNIVPSPNTNSAVVTTTLVHNFIAGDAVTIAGNSVSAYNTSYVISGAPTSTSFIVSVVGFFTGGTGAGGTATISRPPPVSDTTQQTCLFKMPVIIGSPATFPVSYDNSNIVARFPADPLQLILPDGGGGGGGGGGGLPGGGGSTGGGITPSGGQAQNVTMIPQMLEFINQVIIALGNGFQPQIYSDLTTTVNPAKISTIAAAPTGAVENAAGDTATITTTAPHGLTSAMVGANVIISGVTDPTFNGVFVVLTVPSTTTFTVRNTSSAPNATSGSGTVTTTTIPIVSNFIPAFPVWSATTVYVTNSIVQPTPNPNNIFFKAIQGGTSGGVQPTWPLSMGNQVADGAVIWQNQGSTNLGAPPPPGAGHIAVYAGSLWVWNTSPSNTANGLDGPCSLRMSDVNNPNSWNPINQAFLDKDDGTEGMGLTAFTITAQGIPPQGSLVVFKNYATYQIVSVFGSPNFAIQRIKSDMGCTAPRTIEFVPGFGISRYTHLGVAIFDGVDDHVTSEEIRPYLFPSNDVDEADITVVDSNWIAVAWSTQTANPPMYVLAAPIGSSGGKLTRLFCYDLVLKAWTAPIDLPFAISTIAQFRTIVANPVTVMGGFADGVLQRWQSGDIQWYIGATGPGPASLPSQVVWSIRLPEVASQAADQKLYCRRLVTRGISTGSTSIAVTLRINGANNGTQTYAIPSSGDFDLFSSVRRDILRISATLSGSGLVELDRMDWHVSEKKLGVPLVVS